MNKPHEPTDHAEKALAVAKAQLIRCRLGVHFPFFGNLGIAVVYFSQKTFDEVQMAMMVIKGKLVEAHHPEIAAMLVFEKATV